MDNKTTTIVPSELFDLAELLKVSRVVSLLKDGILMINLNYIETYFIFDAIHNSSILKSQKKLLIDKLNKTVNDEFFYLIKTLKNELVIDNEYTRELHEYCKEIANFEFFDLVGKNELVKIKSDLEYTSRSFDYTKIKDKY